MVGTKRGRDIGRDTRRVAMSEVLVLDEPALGRYVYCIRGALLVD